MKCSFTKRTFKKKSPFCLFVCLSNYLLNGLLCPGSAFPRRRSHFCVFEVQEEKGQKHRQACNLVCTALCVCLLWPSGLPGKPTHSWLEKPQLNTLRRGFLGAIVSTVGWKSDILCGSQLLVASCFWKRGSQQNEQVISKWSAFLELRGLWKLQSPGKGALFRSSKCSRSGFYQSWKSPTWLTEQDWNSPTWPIELSPSYLIWDF